MREGLKVGLQHTVTATVTPEMYAQFEGEIVHETYATMWMVYHMEYASRRMILPYLEEHEEGIGAGVEVIHLAPTPAGMEIRATATLTEIDGNRLVSEVEVWNPKKKIGTGKVTQVVLPKEVIRRRIREMREA